MFPVQALFCGCSSSMKRTAAGPRHVNQALLQTPTNITARRYFIATQPRRASKQSQPQSLTLRKSLKLLGLLDGGSGGSSGQRRGDTTSSSIRKRLLRLNKQQVKAAYRSRAKELHPDVIAAKEEVQQAAVGSAGGKSPPASRENSGGKRSLGEQFVELQEAVKLVVDAMAKEHQSSSRKSGGGASEDSGNGAMREEDADSSSMIIDVEYELQRILDLHHDETTERFGGYSNGDSVSSSSATDGVLDKLMSTVVVTERECTSIIDNFVKSTPTALCGTKSMSIVLPNANLSFLAPVAEFAASFKKVQSKLVFNVIKNRPKHEKKFRILKLKRKDQGSSFSEKRQNSDLFSTSSANVHSKRVKKIEECAFKPLVLIGTLKVEVGGGGATVENAEQATESKRSDVAGTTDKDDGSGATQNAAETETKHESEEKTTTEANEEEEEGPHVSIEETPFLECAVSTKDTFADLVRKIGMWEQESFFIFQRYQAMHLNLEVFFQENAIAGADVGGTGATAAFPPGTASDVSISSSDLITNDKRLVEKYVRTCEALAINALAECQNEKASILKEWGDVMEDLHVSVFGSTETVGHKTTSSSHLYVGRSQHCLLKKINIRPPLNAENDLIASVAQVFSFTEQQDGNSEQKKALLAMGNQQESSTNQFDTAVMQPQPLSAKAKLSENVVATPDEAAVLTAGGDKKERLSPFYYGSFQEDGYCVTRSTECSDFNSENYEAEIALHGSYTVFKSRILAVLREVHQRHLERQGVTDRVKHLKQQVQEEEFFQYTDHYTTAATRNGVRAATAGSGLFAGLSHQKTAADAALDDLLASISSPSSNGPSATTDPVIPSSNEADVPEESVPAEPVALPKHVPALSEEQIDDLCTSPKSVHRAPIQHYIRLVGFEAHDELQFWRHIHEHRYGINSLQDSVNASNSSSSASATNPFQSLWTPVLAEFPFLVDKLDEKALGTFEVRLVGSEERRRRVAAAADGAHDCQESTETAEEEDDTHLPELNFFRDDGLQQIALSASTLYRRDPSSNSVEKEEEGGEESDFYSGFLVPTHILSTAALAATTIQDHYGCSYISCEGINPLEYLQFLQRFVPSASRVTVEEAVLKAFGAPASKINAAEHGDDQHSVPRDSGPSAALEAQRLRTSSIHDRFGFQLVITEGPEIEVVQGRLCVPYYVDMDQLVRMLHSPEAILQLMS